MANRYTLNCPVVALLVWAGNLACFYDPTGVLDTTGTTAGETGTNSPTTGLTETTNAEATGSTDPDEPDATTATTATSSTGNGDTTVTTTEDIDPLPPEATALNLTFSQVKHFDFTWAAAAGATYYQLLERLPDGASYVQLGADIVGEAATVTMPLHLRFGASYRLRACNSGGCTDSQPVDVVDSLATAVGYFKASNTDPSDNFGVAVALSADGDTLAVGAHRDDSAADGIDGDQTDDSLDAAGAVHVFIRHNDTWTQQAYIKASNPDIQDMFGEHIALSADGDTLAVGAIGENGSATGINGDQFGAPKNDTGAVYVFARMDDAWTQQAYVKASNTGGDDWFGSSLALSADGSTLAVGAITERSAATGIDGDQTDDSLGSAGAAYVFVRAAGVWSQQAYIKASNTDQADFFGWSIALSADGDTLAVGALNESSASTDINGAQADDSAEQAGAAYVFVRTGGAWEQQAYIKASNTDPGDGFGFGLALSADGDTLAISATGESSMATGVGGDQTDNSAEGAGAVYIYVRTEGKWIQQAYIKASNTSDIDLFGFGVALSGDGDTLAVGARQEDSAAIGIAGDQADTSADISGAVYVFVRDKGTWSQRAYVKAPNTGMGDRFGSCVALATDGETLAVGAEVEMSAAVGIGGDQTDDAAPSAGAVYLF